LSYSSLHSRGRPRSIDHAITTFERDRFDEITERRIQRQLEQQTGCASSFSFMLFVCLPVCLSAFPSVRLFVYAVCPSVSSLGTCLSVSQSVSLAVSKKIYFIYETESACQVEDFCARLPPSLPACRPALQHRLASCLRNVSLSRLSVGEWKTGACESPFLTHLFDRLSCMGDVARSLHNKLRDRGGNEWKREMGASRGIRCGERSQKTIEVVFISCVNSELI